MRFSLTTITIALLGSAMALPSSEVNHVEERAAVSAVPRDSCNVVVNSITALQTQTAAVVMLATLKVAYVSSKTQMSSAACGEIDELRARKGNISRLPD
ncbi:hypothetical protein J7T55_009737 [Diaporthe amygdali]|uniref:uncharacterized protein n=1 Tax=Phomopsis amygdali TaxID=1214568 RepID=UPI0022FF44F8|nr:uncharacterized protein J7T55_009737 [Diaporthe amygdali]KAJ0116587.1 hypothetical protein J7T55_009737 [Diaporthe amygdali]